MGGEHRESSTNTEKNREPVLIVIGELTLA